MNQDQQKQDSQHDYNEGCINNAHGYNFTNMRSLPLSRQGESSNYYPVNTNFVLSRDSGDIDVANQDFLNTTCETGTNCIHGNSLLYATGQKVGVTSMDMRQSGRHSKMSKYRKCISDSDPYDSGQDQQSNDVLVSDKRISGSTAMIPPQDNGHVYTNSNHMQQNQIPRSNVGYVHIDPLHLNQLTSANNIHLRNMHIGGNTPIPISNNSGKRQINEETSNHHNLTIQHNIAPAITLNVHGAPISYSNGVATITTEFPNISSPNHHPHVNVGSSSTFVGHPTSLATSSTMLPVAHGEGLNVYQNPNSTVNSKDMLKKQSRNQREQKRAHLITEKIEALRDIIDQSGLEWEDDNNLNMQSKSKYHILIGCDKYIQHLKSKISKLQDELDHSLIHVNDSTVSVESDIKSSQLGKAYYKKEENHLNHEKNDNIQGKTMEGLISQTLSVKEELPDCNVTSRETHIPPSILSHHVSIFQNLHVPMAIANLNGDLIDFNSELIRVVGENSHAIVYRSLFHLIDAAYGDVLFQKLLEYVNENQYPTVGIGESAMETDEVELEGDENNLTVRKDKRLNMGTDGQESLNSFQDGSNNSSESSGLTTTNSSSTSGITTTETDLKSKRDNRTFKKLNRTSQDSLLTMYQFFMQTRKSEKNGFCDLEEVTTAIQRSATFAIPTIDLPLKEYQPATLYITMISDDDVYNHGYQTSVDLKAGKTGNCENKRKKKTNFIQCSILPDGGFIDSFTQSFSNLSMNIYKEESIKPEDSVSVFKNEKKRKQTNGNDS